METTTGPASFQFASPEQQAHAVRVGMWIFLASEALLFGGMFALWGAYYVHYPEGFYEGARHNDVVLGTFNTVVLITSSLAIALADWKLHLGRVVAARRLVMLTVAFAFVFLVVKAVEYWAHVADGILPGGRGHYFGGDVVQGEAIFYTLYYLMTGAHAIHVIVGIAVLSWLARSLRRGVVGPHRAQALEVGGLYWHLVDIVWIFLWPMLYLIRGT